MGRPRSANPSPGALRYRKWYENPENRKKALLKKLIYKLLHNKTRSTREGVNYKPYLSTFVKHNVRLEQAQNKARSQPKPYELKYETLATVFQDNSMRPADDVAQTQPEPTVLNNLVRQSDLLRARERRGTIRRDTRASGSSVPTPEPPTDNKKDITEHTFEELWLLITKFHDAIHAGETEYDGVKNLPQLHQNQKDRRGLAKVNKKTLKTRKSGLLKLLKGLRDQGTIQFDIEKDKRFVPKVWGDATVIEEVRKAVDALDNRETTKNTMWQHFSAPTVWLKDFTNIEEIVSNANYNKMAGRHAISNARNLERIYKDIKVGVAWEEVLKYNPKKIAKDVTPTSSIIDTNMALLNQLYLYSDAEAVVRDNFGGSIILWEGDASDENIAQNFYSIKDNTMNIVFFKTKDKYNPVVLKLDKSFPTLVLKVLKTRHKDDPILKNITSSGQFKKLAMKNDKFQVSDNMEPFKLITVENASALIKKTVGVTVNDLRHSFANYMWRRYGNNPGKMQRLANLMGHSLETNNQYSQIEVWPYAKFTEWQKAWQSSKIPHDEFWPERQRGVDINIWPDYTQTAQRRR